MRKSVKTFVAGVMAGILLFQSPTVALADSEKVVTLGADLTEQQRADMLKYFGVTEDEVAIIEVNNQEERQYLEGIATNAEIGTHTYSCAYIMPTEDGKINVKTANLTWVSTSMIANTLVTAGIDSCDVIAAAPKSVSGTGALTGIIKAYEKVTDDELDEEKTELAMKELYATAKIGKGVGKDEASAVMNEVKNKVIKDNITDKDKVEDVVDEVAEYYDVQLTDEQKEEVADLMSQIGKQDYDYDQLKGTIDDLQDNLVDKMDNVSKSFEDSKKGFFASIGSFFASIFKAIGDFFAGLFGGSDDEKKEESILDGTDESALGIEPTAEASDDTNTQEDTNNTETTEVTQAPEDDTNTMTNEQSESFDTEQSAMDDAVKENTTDINPADAIAADDSVG